MRARSREEPGRRDGRNSLGRLGDVGTIRLDPHIDFAEFKNEALGQREQERDVSGRWIRVLLFTHPDIGKTGPGRNTALVVHEEVAAGRGSGMDLLKILTRPKRWREFSGVKRRLLGDYRSQG